MNHEQLLKRIDEVIITDATDTPAAAFMATHIPFKNLQYLDNGVEDGNEKHVDENAFLKEYCEQQSDKHNLIIVEGDSGSGKSHFIRWMMESYSRTADSNEIIIQVRRHQNTLKGAIKQILESEVFQSEEYKEITRKLLFAKEQLDDNELIYSIKNGFLTKLEAKQDFENEQVSKSENDRLIEFLKTNYAFEHLFAKKDGPLRRIQTKVSSNDETVQQDELDARFLAKDFEIDIEFREQFEDGDINRRAKQFAKDIYKSEEFRERVASYLNTMVDGVIQLCTQLNGEDFTNLFYELRKVLKLQGKSLTLFVEDITSFTGVDKGLLEALIVEHQSKPEICKLSSFVGITKSYYKNSIPDNIKQRVTGRILVSDNSIFQNQEDLLIMTSRYMNAINTESEKLEQWVREDGTIDGLPVSELHKKHKWSVYDDPILGEVSLFPFNQRAVIQLYGTLKEKTPRMFLRQVIKYVYVKYLRETDTFPGSWKSFENYFKVPAWAESLHNNLVADQEEGGAEKLSCILRVWGNRTAYRTEKDGISYLGDLPKEVFETFNASFIKGIKKDGQKIQGSKVQTLSQQNTAQMTAEVSEIPSIEPTLASKPVGETPEEKAKRQTQEKYGKELTILDNWFNHEYKLTNHKQFRGDVSSFLYSFIDWKAVGVPRYLVDNFFGNNGSSVQRVHIVGQVTEISEGIQINRTRENYKFLQALLAYRILGGNSWGFEDSTYYLIQVYDWIEANKASIIDLIMNKQAGSKWEPLKWAIYNQYILLVINGNIAKNESLENIYGKVVNGNSTFVRASNPGLNPSEAHSDEWNKAIKAISGKDIRNSYELMIYTQKIVLGDVGVEKASEFLDAVEILKEIKKLRKEKWTLAGLPEFISNKSINFYSYDLMQKLVNLIEKLISIEKSEATQKINHIKQFVNTEDIESSFYKMQRYLKQVLNGKAQGVYSEETFKLVFMDDKKMDQMAKTVKSTIEAIEQLAETGVSALDKLTRTSTRALVEYEKVLVEMDKLLDRNISKYQKIINDNSIGLNKYNENRKALEASIKDVARGITTLGGEA